MSSCCLGLWSTCFLCILGLTVGALSVRILELSSNCSLFSLGLTQGTLANGEVVLIKGTPSVCSIGINVDVFSDFTLLNLGLTGGGASPVGSVLPVILLSHGISISVTTVLIIESSAGTRALACETVAEEKCPKHSKLANPLLGDKTFGSTSELFCNAVEPLVFLGFGTGAFVELALLFISAVSSGITWEHKLIIMHSTF